MTLNWADFVAKGGGDIQLRVAFEGCPDEWVSHRSLAGAVGDGRTRRYGLVPVAEFLEKAILQESDLELSGQTMTIEEREDERATYGFVRTARVLGWLAADVGTTSPAVVSVDNTSRFTLNTYVFAGTETWKVTAKTTSTITVNRAQWQSQIQEHYVEVGAESKTVPITDAPGAFTRRRAYLYAHGLTELSSTATGTLIWRGVVAAEPTCVDLVRWQIPLDPITVVLDQVVAGDTDRALNLSGIYYPYTAPFRFSITEFAAATMGSVSAETGAQYLVGYYETVDTFIAALNAKLAAATPSPTWKNTYAFQRDADGHPVLVVNSSLSDPRYFQIQGGSPIDGAFSHSGLPTLYAAHVQAYLLQHVVVGGNAYTCALANSGQAIRRGFPRAWLGGWLPTSGGDPIAAEYVNAPDRRIHLSGSLGGTADDAIEINLYGSSTERRAVSLEIDSVGVTAGKNDVTITPLVYHEPLDASTEVRLARKYAVNADLRTFQGALIAQAVKKNRGSTPNITSDDMAGWPDAEDAAEELGRFAGLRSYIFAKPLRVGDVLREELKLVGCCLTLDSLYRIGCFRLRAPANTEASVLHLTDDIILSDNWPTWTKEKGGIVNAVVVRQGYDALADEHKGIPHTVRDVTSISEHGFTQTLEIAPYSGTEFEIEYDDAAKIARGPNAFFQKFHVLDVPVNWKAWNARLGDTVSITSSKLPNPTTGTRGIVGLTATVIGRQWRIPGFGRLTLLLHARRVLGYSPAVKLAVTNQASALSHTFTVEQSYFSPTGVNDTSFFAVGDRVTHRRWNMTPQLRNGEITALTATTMTVTWASALSLRVDAGWFVTVQFRDHADTYATSDNAARYAWIADAGNLLYSGDDAAEFAP